jgi:hypothetical protein
MGSRASTMTSDSRTARNFVLLFIIRSPYLKIERIAGDRTGMAPAAL